MTEVNRTCAIGSCQRTADHKGYHWAATYGHIRFWCEAYEHPTPEDLEEAEAWQDQQNASPALTFEKWWSALVLPDPDDVEVSMKTVAQAAWNAARENLC
jgi:hypothetical protein